MFTTTSRIILAACTAQLAAWLLVAQGCGRSRTDDIKLSGRSPNQAAAALDRAFADAPAAVKENAGIASDALRQQNFEKAVISLQAVRSAPGITLEQGLAIHGSVLTMEDRLVRAMEAGDENAKRAYQLLKAMKRK